MSYHDIAKENAKQFIIVLLKSFLCQLAIYLFEFVRSFLFINNKKRKNMMIFTFK